jgi:hypothetical protein
MRVIKLPQFQNVGPNQRVSVPLSLGVTYEKLYIKLGTNITSALISNIVLKINNKEFMRWDRAADLIALNAYKGNQTAAGYLTLDFTERLARDEVAMKLGTIAATQQAGVQSLTLEFDLGNYVPAVGSTIEGWADIEAPSANKIIQRVQTQQKVIGGAATEQVIVPYGQNGFQVKRLIVRHANVTSIKVRRDGVDIYEDLPIALAHQRQVDFGRTPQAGYHILDFMPDALQSNALNTAFIQVAPDKAVAVENLDIRITTSAADVITIFTESYALNSQL